MYMSILTDVTLCQPLRTSSSMAAVFRRFSAMSGTNLRNGKQRSQAMKKAKFYVEFCWGEWKKNPYLETPFVSYFFKANGGFP